MHKMERDDNPFSEGIRGWKYVLSKLKPKQQPEEFQNQSQQKSSLALPEKKGWSI